MTFDSVKLNKIYGILDDYKKKKLSYFLENKLFLLIDNFILLFVYKIANLKGLKNNEKFKQYYI